MKERPILFSAPMIRAILEGRKSQTRRVVVPGRGQIWLTPETIGKVLRFERSADDWWIMAVGEPNRIVHCGVEMDGGHIGSVRCPQGEPGDRLWVRETWRIVDPAEVDIMFAADEMQRRCLDSPDHWWRGKRPDGERWRPSIFMPRWASRITLEITDVRVARLRDISSADAIAEGIRPAANNSTIDCATDDPRSEFAALWDSINGGRPWKCWDDNPWVWAITFRRLP